MQSLIAHGPIFTTFLSFDDWSERGKLIFHAHNGGPSYTVHVDARGRICARGTHYTRARDEGAFPVVVYKIDEE